MVILNPILNSKKSIKRKTKFFKLTKEQMEEETEFEKRLRTDKDFRDYIESEIDKTLEEVHNGIRFPMADVFKELEEEHKKYE